MNYDFYAQPLEQTVADAWALRSQFDLTGVGYGKIHWNNFTDILRKPFSYYYFLAGLVRLTHAKKVLEVGTHQGGSSRSMAKGFADPGSSRIVTFDVTPDGAASFAGDPLVKAYTMDANAESASSSALGDFGGSSIDMAFIDSTHEFWTTLQSFATVSTVFRCPLIVVDDITLNPSMARMWKIVVDRYGADNAINAADVDPAIRPVDGGTTPGFGVVRLPVR